MQYNLFRNGSLSANTTSGTGGNLSLTWSQLESLMDQVLDTGGVTVSGSDVLYLDGDLSQRIKVDGINLYHTGASASDVTFYYKNEPTDSYTLRPTLSGVGYFYTTIPDPSAPRYIRCTISGASAQLHEFQVFNDDYIVTFGTDGLLTTEYLGETPQGEESGVNAVPIYNNGTSSTPANAYVCVEPQGQDEDKYLEISESENGPFYSLDDGGFIEDDDVDSTWKWSDGDMTALTIYTNSLVISPVTATGTGTYISPIFKLTSDMNSSFWIVDGTTESGTSSISYDPDVYNGTIRVRSNDTAPLTIDEVFILYNGVPSDIAKWVPYTSSLATTFISLPGLYLARSTAVDRRTGEIVIASYFTFSPDEGVVEKYDRNGDLLYIKQATGNSRDSYNFGHRMVIDKYGGVWGYNGATGYDSSWYYHLYHFDNDLNYEYVDLNDGTDFLYDLAEEMDGDGLWYTSKYDYSVVHLDYEGNTTNTILLPNPKVICGALDNGFWVAEWGDDKLIRYDSDGTLIHSVSIGHDADFICHDYENGCWYKYGDSVYHVRSSGSRNVGPVVIYQAEALKPSHDGVYVISTTTNKVYFINNSGVVTKTLNHSLTADLEYFSVFSYNHSDFAEFKTTAILPVSYDPVWGAGGSLDWTEVVKDGYFLPKVYYHQVEATLRGTGGSIDKLIMAPAVNIPDITRQTSKNVYVKAVIPVGASVENYTTKIRTWWGLGD